MIRKKKFVIILIVAVLLLCILSSLCLGILYAFFSSIIKQENEITDKILLNVCESHGTFSETEYKAWFTNDYRQSVDYLKATSDIKSIFPDDFDCSRLKTRNLFDIFKNRQSVHIEYTIQNTTAEISFPKTDDEQITIYFVKIGEEWEINKLELIQTSG